MGKLTEKKPKCLVSLGNEDTILSRQISMLLEEGIDDILITIGPYGDVIPDYLKDKFPSLDIVYIRNDIYDKTNYIYSMHMAGDLLREDILLLHGDIVLEEQVLKGIVSSPNQNSAVIDRTAPLPEKDFKGRMDGEYITEIGIYLPHEDGIAFLLPVYKLSSNFMNAWMDEIRSFVLKGEIGVYAENAFNAMKHKPKLLGYDIQGRFCMEVDTEEDLYVAIGKING